MYRFQRLGRALPGLVFLFAFVVFAGCGDDDSPTEPRIYDPNEYLLNLPSWQEAEPTLPDAEVVGDAVAQIDWEQNLVCQETECSLTKTPSEIVTYDPGSEILYLGSLIQGDSHVGGVGSIAELPIRERAPLTISIDLHIPNSSRTIENPTLATVDDAIHDLIAAADAEGHDAGSDIYYQKMTSESVEQASLSLGFSARYMGATLKTRLNKERTHEESQVTAYFVQSMFTTSVVLPARPGDFFSADFTQARLDEEVRLGRIGPDNLPVFVSNIVWGRMMMLTMTSSMEASRMEAALAASYAGIGGTVEAQHLEVLQNSKIELVTIGGPEDAALGYLKTGNLGEFFNTRAPLTTAAPLSYTLRNLADPDYSIADVSETTEYTIRECGGLGVVVTQNEAEWRDMVLSAGFDLHEFPFTAANVSLANETGYVPGKNREVGGVLTWESVSTGLPFDFVLTATEGHMTYYDDEGFGNNTLSIGDIDNWQNDDFSVEVTGEKVYAMAIYIHDNTAMAGEDVTVWGATEGGGEEYMEQLPRGYNGWLGIVSPVPLRRIEFNEDGGGDDIALYHVRFAHDPE
jgi:hypothetical protein